jgi:hypothetical protein
VIAGPKPAPLAPRLPPEGDATAPEFIERKGKGYVARIPWQGKGGQSGVAKRSVTLKDIKALTTALEIAEHEAVEIIFERLEEMHDRGYAGPGNPERWTKEFLEGCITRVVARKNLEATPVLSETVSATPDVQDRRDDPGKGIQLFSDEKLAEHYSWLPKPDPDPGRVH